MNNPSCSRKVLNDAAQKSGLCKKETPDIIYHYTTVGALKGILFGCENPDQISLHFSHFQYLNDATEVTYGLRAINQIACKLMEEYNDLYKTEEGKKYKDIAAVDLLDKPLNHLIIRFCDEASAKDFLEDYKKRNPSKSNGFNQLDMAFRNHRSAIFLGSFAKSPDNKKMWRNYADKSRGVCIAFDTQKMKEKFSIINSKLGLMTHINYMRQCELNSSIEKFFRSAIEAIVAHHDQKKDIKALLQNDSSGDFNLFTLMTLWLVETIATTKNPKWKNEDEIRIFWPHLKTERIREVKYKTGANGELKPYIPLLFPKEVISNIMIGSGCKKPTIEAINMMLKTKGVISR